MAFASGIVFQQKKTKTELPRKIDVAYTFQGRIQPEVEGGGNLERGRQKENEK